MTNPPDTSEQILVLTPTGNDAANAVFVLHQAGLTGRICRDCADLDREFREGAGALLVAEEALTAGTVRCLIELLSMQPQWSDIPLLLITSASETAQAGQTLLNTFAPHGNISLIERPLHPILLVSAMRAALRARRRQYQLRDFLEEQEQTRTRLQIALEAGRLGHWDLDLRTKSATRSRRHDQIFGYEELLPDWSYEIFLQHVHPDDRAHVDDTFQKSVAACGGWEFECRIIRADQRGAWIWARGLCLPGEDGNPRRLMGVVADITERKRAEAELKASEERLRKIFTSAALGLGLIDLNKRFLRVNPAFVAITGYSEEELLQMSLGDLNHPDDVPPNNELLRQLKERKIPQFEMEKRYVRKDRRIIWVSAIVSLLFDAEGKPQFLGVIQDITERKQIEEELRNAREHLEKTVQQRTAELQTKVGELEAFSYSVSHDLRAPLRAMQGFSRFLIEDYSDRLDETGKDYINRIVTAAERLDRLVSDILTYSRFARADIKTSPIDLERLIRDVIEHYPTLQEPHATIEITRPLPRVTGHEGSLTQCISNILGNAVKFVALGVKPRIRIWSEPLDAKVRIHFQDNGIGIPPEQHHRIFQMFEKGSHSQLYEGTGIGLAIVQKAVGRMGGQVGVESQPGQGSRFWIQLSKAS
jgi:PAS domain S-box-containing protein